MEDSFSTGSKYSYFSKLVGNHEITEIVGAGAFGIVARIEPKGQRTTTPFVMKRTYIKAIGDNGQEMFERQEEIKMISYLKTWKHPNVVQHYEGFLEFSQDAWLQENDPLWNEWVKVQSEAGNMGTETLADHTASRIPMTIIQEYCPGGSLRKYLETTTDRQFGLKFLLQIATGLDFLHVRGIIHRDLKPDNILLDTALWERPERATLKIGDFGVASFENEENHRMAPMYGNVEDYEKVMAALRIGIANKPGRITKPQGSPLYRAPEQFSENPFGHKVDMYSLGLIAYELMADLSKKAVRHAAFKALTANQRLPGEFKSTRVAEGQLIFDMVSKSPELRPDAKAVIDRAKSISCEQSPLPMWMGDHFDASNFFARETELAELTKLFESSAEEGCTVILNGPIGVGKSHLAMHFANFLHVERRMSVFWFDLVEPRFKANVVNLMEALQLDNPDDGMMQANRDKLSLIHQTLRLRGDPSHRWTLVIKDFEDFYSDWDIRDIYHLQSLRSPKPFVLILSEDTFRLTAVPNNNLNILQLKPLSADSVPWIFQHPYSETLNDSEIQKLSDSLNSCPLAVEMAVANISFENLTVAEYLDELGRQKLIFNDLLYDEVCNHEHDSQEAQDQFLISLLTIIVNVERVFQSGEAGKVGVALLVLFHMFSRLGEMASDFNAEILIKSCNKGGVKSFLMKNRGFCEEGLRIAEAYKLCRVNGGRGGTIRQQKMAWIAFGIWPGWKGFWTLFPTE